MIRERYIKEWAARHPWRRAYLRSGVRIFGDRPRERLILTTEYTEYTEQWGFAAVEMREIW